MPLPVTSSSGSAVTLVPPPSQQTAPVHEFRCLFTHDLRRKAKRWQDGFLTFHTFNNRAVVYDEHRHRIGDVYTKSGGDSGGGDSGGSGVQEGDELTLQQGVLVEVGEALSSREQDVSGVIVTREAPRNVGSQATISGARGAGLLRGLVGGLKAGNELATNLRQAGVPVPAAVPATGTGSGPVPLQRPKSLKELLSTPAGSMGRSRLFRSPYERRQGIAGTSSNRRDAEQPVQVCRIAPAAPVRTEQEISRPSKRQRVEDNRCEAQGMQPPSARLAQNRQPVRPTAQAAKQPSQATPPRPGTRAASPILLESDEESALQSSLNITPMASRVELEPQTEPEMDRSLPAGVTTMAVGRETSPNAEQQQSKKTKDRGRKDKRPRSEPTEYPDPSETQRTSDPTAKNVTERLSKKRKKSRNDTTAERPAKDKKTKKKTRKGAQSRDDSAKNTSAPEVVNLSSSENPAARPPSRPLRERSANTLRLSSTGRRRNIMYKELLPEGFVPRKPVSRHSTDENVKGSSRSDRSPGRASLAEAAASLSINAQKRRQKARKSVPSIFEDFDKEDDAALVALEQESVVSSAAKGQGHVRDEQDISSADSGRGDDESEDIPQADFDENHVAVPLSTPEENIALDMAQDKTAEPAAESVAESNSLVEDSNGFGQFTTMDAMADFLFESELENQLEPTADREEVGPEVPRFGTEKQKASISSAEAMPPPAAPTRPATKPPAVPPSGLEEQSEAQDSAPQPPDLPISLPAQAQAQAPAQSNTSAASSTIFRGMPPYRRPQLAAKLTRPREPALPPATTADISALANNPNLPSPTLADPETCNSHDASSRPRRSTRSNQPQVRSPLKRVISAPAPESPRQKRPLVKSFSELGTAGGNNSAGRASIVGDHGVPLDPFLADQLRDRENDRGPWSREAFDLFGWRVGDKKGVDDVGG